MKRLTRVAEEPSQDVPPSDAKKKRTRCVASAPSPLPVHDIVGCRPRPPSPFPGRSLAFVRCISFLVLLLRGVMLSTNDKASLISVIQGMASCPKVAPPPPFPSCSLLTVTIPYAGILLHPIHTRRVGRIVVLRVPHPRGDEAWGPRQVPLPVCRGGTLPLH